MLLQLAHRKSLCPQRRSSFVHHAGRRIGWIRNVLSEVKAPVADVASGLLLVRRSRWKSLTHLSPARSSARQFRCWWHVAAVVRAVPDARANDRSDCGEMAGRVKVAKLNVDENHRTAARFKISGIPAMLIFKDGREVDRIVGLAAKRRLRSGCNGSSDPPFITV